MNAIRTPFAGAGLALVCWINLAGAYARLQAQTPASPSQQTAAQDAVAKQQAAISLMQESIARQRTSVQQQMGQSTRSFFILPPPAPMEGLTAGAGFPGCAPLNDSEVRSLASQAATREGLDADLLIKVMQQESGFLPCAVSPKGAMGLMQLMPSTAEQFGVKDTFDPLENVGAGARFLRELLSRYNGDVFKAVSAYNAGPGRVDSADGIPQIPETINYINRILLPDLKKP